jgi:hypothetical protein
MVESQYWPLVGDGPAGETGLAQITPAALDQYLRLYSPGYYQLTPSQRQSLQNDLYKRLQCQLCTLEQAVEQERRNLTLYARILRAYRLTSPDWRAAVVAWNGVYAERIFR